MTTYLIGSCRCIGSGGVIGKGTSGNCSCWRNAGGIRYVMSVVLGEVQELVLKIAARDKR